MTQHQERINGVAASYHMDCTHATKNSDSNAISV